MARRFRGVSRARKQNRDVIWVTSIIDASLLESTVLDFVDVVLPVDWSAGNAGFDRATLLAVRGWLSFVQQAAATPAENTGVYAAMYVTDNQLAANGFNPSVAAEYVENDVLWTTGMSFTGTGTLGAYADSREINVKVKRKINSTTRVSMAAFIPADTATPRLGINGVVRALIQLDPPR